MRGLLVVCACLLTLLGGTPARAQGTTGAQASCELELWRFYRFEISHHGESGDAHYHLYHVEAGSSTTPPRLRRGLTEPRPSSWGAIFGYWDDGECGYHQDAYVLHFERRAGVPDAPWLGRAEPGPARRSVDCCAPTTSAGKPARTAWHGAPRAGDGSSTSWT